MDPEEKRHRDDMEVEAARLQREWIAYWVLLIVLAIGILGVVFG